MNKGEKEDKMKALSTSLVPQNATAAQKKMADRLSKVVEYDASDINNGAATSENVKMQKINKDILEKRSTISDTGKIIYSKTEGTQEQISAYWNKLIDLQQKTLDATTSGKHTSIHIGASSVTEALGVFTNRMGT